MDRIQELNAAQLVFSSILIILSILSLLRLYIRVGSFDCTILKSRVPSLRALPAGT